MSKTILSHWVKSDTETWGCMEDPSPTIFIMPGDMVNSKYYQFHWGSPDGIAKEYVVAYEKGAYNRRYLFTSDDYEEVLRYAEEFIFSLGGAILENSFEDFQIKWRTESIYAPNIEEQQKSIEEGLPNNE